MASSQPIPVTRVISPSPTPGESSSRDNYFGTATKKSNGHITTQAPISESPESSDPESSRARPRSRSPQIRRKDSSKKTLKSPPEPIKTDGHLDPNSMLGMGSSYWRNLSRSPSPLGLIPLHREWRSFIHRHEIPRKALHVSIGFFTLGLFVGGAQTNAIHPPLLTALIPIFAVDFLRMHYPYVFFPR